MKTTIGMLCVIAALASPARADTATTFGIGNASCATWLSTKQLEHEGMVWVMGAWSGFNIGSPRRNVGRDTDAKGLVAAVKLECQRDLSVLLVKVVSTVYGNFLRAGR